MIWPYESCDFEDVAYLNKICYLKPCSDEELRGKLQNPSWVVCDDGRVVGCIITCSDADKVWIWSVAVSPNHRKRGIASSLLAKVEEHYSGKELWLRVDTHNPAQKLYFDCGYRAAQLIKDFYGQGYDAVEMYKRC